MDGIYDNLSYVISLYLGAQDNDNPDRPVQNINTKGLQLPRGFLFGRIQLMIKKIVFFKSQLLIFFLGILPLVGICDTTAPSKQSTRPLSSTDSLFKQGLAEFRANKFTEATRSFLNVLAQDPNNSAVLTNLGLCSLKIDQKGWALAYFRKALNLDHGLTEARSAMNETLSKLEVKELPHQNSWYESLRQSFLNQISIDFLVALTLASFLLTGWWLLSYLGQRRRNAKSDLPAPAIPFPALVVGVFFVLLSGLALLKLYDTFHVSRGTVVSKKSSIFSAPEASQSALFEIYEGLEVEILDQSGDYYQVQYPGGASGWISKKDVFITD